MEKEGKMIKKEIVNRLSFKTGLEKKQLSIIVDRFLEVLKNTLERGEEIELRGFGCFRFQERQSQNAYDFQKKVPIKIPARTIVVFKQSSKLKIDR